MSDRTPVLVGISQILQRTEDPAESKEPLELMVEAVERRCPRLGIPRRFSAKTSPRSV